MGAEGLFGQSVDCVREELSEKDYTQKLCGRREPYAMAGAPRKIGYHINYRLLNKFSYFLFYTTDLRTGGEQGQDEGTAGVKRACRVSSSQICVGEIYLKRHNYITAGQSRVPQIPLAA